MPIRLTTAVATYFNSKRNTHWGGTLTKQDDLVAIVSTLINRKTEGTYWDFKRKHHKDTADLIHDVLCLANAKHTGDRFLIFGVDDEFSLHSIDKDAGRRTQADLVGLFRDNANKFFQSRFPEFYMEEIKLDEKLLDVLVIEDTPHKPYYLVERCKKIRAHHIYTRISDTNTPVNDAAQPHEIERMWRERFGLDMPPLERAKRYLSEPDAWLPLEESDGSNANFYHIGFPEFTLRVTDAEDYIACHEEWTRGEIRSDNNQAWYYDLHYHQTRLARIRSVSFDDGKKSMVAPDWESRGTGRFYFYKADSIAYAVQKFYSKFSRRNVSTTLSIRGKGDASDEARSQWDQMKIPVLRTGELEDFLGTDGECELVEASQDEAEQYQLFLRNQLDFEYWRKRQRKG